VARRGERTRRVPEGRSKSWEASHQRRPTRPAAGAEAVEAAIRVTREEGRVEARGERSQWPRPRADDQPRREAIV
jgi:hypothetical protein